MRKVLTSLSMALAVLVLPHVLPAQNARRPAGPRPKTASDPTAEAGLRIGGRPPAEILKMLGAKVEAGVTDEKLRAYAAHFDHVDADRDGKLTKVEYVDQGSYMTPKARQGIFRASDGNHDGIVTKQEYVLNRVITDEAKAIVQAMDSDEDGTTSRAEFLRNSPLTDGRLAAKVFAALDTDGNGKLAIPEYLRVWGQWARTTRREIKLP